MKTTFIVMTLACYAYTICTAQSSTEKINKTIGFEKKSAQNALLVYNIDGDVTIEGTTGDQVIIEVEKIINAKTSERLQLGKDAVQLGVIDRADTLILYVKGTGQEFGKRNFKNRDKSYWGYYNQGEKEGRWGSDWNNPPYDYQMNFKIKLPAGIHIMASTINDGDVVVHNVTGKVKARNVNGSINLAGMSGATDAHTINGNVDINYNKNPTEDCKYYSLNGHVKVNFPSIVSGTMSFKSFNGDLFTNIDPLENMPPMVTKTESGKGTKYKIEMQRFKIRNGGPHFDVETFNGDATIKENK
jgi:hypothetical protein